MATDSTRAVRTVRLRLDAQAYEKWQALAAQQQRSVHGQIRYALHRYMQWWEQTQAKSAAPQ